MVIRKSEFVAKTQSCCMPQQEIVLVGQKTIFQCLVVLNIRRIIHILRIVALKLTAYVAIAINFLNGYFLIINLKIYLLLVFKAIFNKI